MKPQLLKIFLCLSIFWIAGISFSYAQPYKAGFGLRGGPGYGLTVKTFVNTQNALEFIVSPRWKGFIVTGLYEKHAPLFDSKRFTYFGGGGLHLGYWDYKDRFDANNPWFDERDTHLISGVDLVLGLEYTFTAIPFSLAVDWKPTLNLIGDSSIWYDDVAFSLRIIPGQM